MGVFRLREIKITCDRCGTDIKLQSGSELQYSGRLITFHREQIGSMPTREQYEVCDICQGKIREFILGADHLLKRVFITGKYP